MKLTYLPAADRKTVSWKNGGGQTQEVAVFPSGASMQHFQWRISMATVDSAGAFSVFRGTDRHLTLLEGRMRLEVNGVWHDLSDGESLRFEGDVPTFGAPVGLSVRDLNIMTRRGRFSAEVSKIEAGDTLPEGGGEGIIFALTATRISDHLLETYDALHIEAPDFTTFHLTQGAVLFIRFVKAAWPQGRV
ncbi:MAG: HutD family protein [Asticcacaulis sp.]